MANEFSTGKSIFVLAIVAGCFAILWPNVFYPMIQGSFSQKDVLTSNQGCCDVMFDSDVNAIKVMAEICEKILVQQMDFDTKLIAAFQQGKLTKAIAEKCQKTVSERCGIDITQFLMDKVRLGGSSYKQMLDEIRSLNSSLCLKNSFGVSLGEIGLPRIIRVWGLNKPKHLRQERPPHLRPEFLHPALREKGRAIPQSNSPVKPSPSQTRVQSGTPLPGMRPPLGGPGQVVPPPKGGGTMGIVMPMYTIGIVVFFLYTMMKLILKKSDSSEAYETFTADPLFQKAVLRDNSFSGIQEIAEDGNKLGDRELDFLKKRLQETEKAMERIVAKMMDLPHPLEQEDAIVCDNLPENKGAVKEKVKNEDNKDDWEISSAQEEDPAEEKIESDGSKDSGDDRNVVKVLGMETTESCEHGAKWSRPSTPLSRPSTPLSRPSTPQNIFIAGSLPSKSQLLVSDSHIETVPHQDNAVVLTGKVTLSLIGLSENNSSGCEEEKKGELNNDGSPKVLGANGVVPNPLTNEIETQMNKIEIGDSMTDCGEGNQ